MAISPRLIRRRIRSVQNTKKITKAMELVAAAKMRRAVAAALKTRAYANLAWGMVEALRETGGEEFHPLLRQSGTSVAKRVYGRMRDLQHDGRSVLYVVMASDRGLCGGFNAAMFREVMRDVHVPRHFDRSAPQRAERRNLDSADRGLATAAPPSFETTKWVAVGKKAEQFVRRQGWDLVASFTNVSVAPTVAELRPIARLAMDAFVNGEVDEVRLAFTDFVSSLRQQPRVRMLLPLQRIAEVGVDSGEHGTVLYKTAAAYNTKPAGGMVTEFLFEPDPKSVLDAMLPRLVELQVYQCYLETGASEHSARMLAMRSASDSAAEMIDDLSLTFNQARQSLITREIAEISAGRAALAA